MWSRTRVSHGVIQPWGDNCHFLAPQLALCSSHTVHLTGTGLGAGPHAINPSLLLTAWPLNHSLLGLSSPYPRAESCLLPPPRNTVTSLHKYNKAHTTGTACTCALLLPHLARWGLWLISSHISQLGNLGHGEWKAFARGTAQIMRGKPGTELGSLLQSAQSDPAGAIPVGTQDKGDSQLKAVHFAIYKCQEGEGLQSL